MGVLVGRAIRQGHNHRANQMSVLTVTVVLYRVVVLSALIGVTVVLAHINLWGNKP